MKRLETWQLLYYATPEKTDQLIKSKDKQRERILINRKAFPSLVEIYEGHKATCKATDNLHEFLLEPKTDG